MKGCRISLVVFAVLLSVLLLAVLLVPALTPASAVASSPPQITVDRTDALLLPVGQSGAVAMNYFENVIASIPLGIALAVVGLSLILGSGFRFVRGQHLQNEGSAGEFHRLFWHLRPA